MKPSRIVKSAHKRAGSKLSLKAFARECAESDNDTRLTIAARVWLFATKPGKTTAATRVTITQHLQPLHGRGPTDAEIAARKAARREAV